MPRLNSWRLVDDAEQARLVVQADGEPVAGRVSMLDRDRGLAALKDGRRFVLSLAAGAAPDRGLQTALRRIEAGDLPQ